MINPYENPVHLCHGCRTCLSYLIDLPMLTEAIASVALDNDPEVHTYALEEE